MNGPSIIKLDAVTVLFNPTSLVSKVPITFAEFKVSVSPETIVPLRVGLFNISVAVLVPSYILFSAITPVIVRGIFVILLGVNVG